MTRPGYGRSRQAERGWSDAFDAAEEVRGARSGQARRLAADGDAAPMARRCRGIGGGPYGEPLPPGLDGGEHAGSKRSSTSWGCSARATAHMSWAGVPASRARRTAFIRRVPAPGPLSRWAAGPPGGAWLPAGVSAASQAMKSGAVEQRPADGCGDIGAENQDGVQALQRRGIAAHADAGAGQRGLAVAHRDRGVARNGRCAPGASPASACCGPPTRSGMKPAREQTGQAHRPVLIEWQAAATFPSGSAESTKSEWLPGSGRGRRQTGQPRHPLPPAAGVPGPGTPRPRPPGGTWRAIWISQYSESGSSAGSRAGFLRQAQRERQGAADSVGQPQRVRPVPVKARAHRLCPDRLIAGQVVDAGPATFTADHVDEFPRPRAPVRPVRPLGGDASQRLREHWLADVCSRRGWRPGRRRRSRGPQAFRARTSPRSANWRSWAGADRKTVLGDIQRRARRLRPGPDGRTADGRHERRR